MGSETDITSLIQDWRSGNDTALEKLTPFVYEELKRLANRHMQREFVQLTLQATALVNEAFIKLAGAEVDYQSRSHFYNMASSMMRRILVDHARAKQSAKRGGKARDLTLEEHNVIDRQDFPAILELDMALDKLAQKEEKLAQVVELIYFGGLSYVEAAKALGMSRTVFYEELQFAKAWLRKELS